MQLINDQASSACVKAEGAQKEGSEFLVFGLGKEEYAVGIQAVQELRGFEAVTQIANAPEYIKGVINLRGTIVPILDMRIRFGMPAPAYNIFTVVIILSVDSRLVGIVVDQVTDVVMLAMDQMLAVPEMQSTIKADYLDAIGVLGERMLIVVDLERLIAGAMLGDIDRLAA